MSLEERSRVRFLNLTCGRARRPQGPLEGSAAAVRTGDGLRICSQAGDCSKADVLRSTPLLGVAARSKNVPGHSISDEQGGVLPGRTLVSVC